MPGSPVREKTVEDLSPRGKKLLKDAEDYLRNKLRNSFQKVLLNCNKLDTLNTGTLDKNVFRTALTRSFACRLTDGEFDAFHLKYHALPRVWVRLEHRPIDLRKVEGLFHDMIGNNDLEDPVKRQRAEKKKKDAEDYVRQQLRLNYKSIFRCFRALDLQQTNSLPLEQFRRVLSRYGGIRFTPDEWWGFSKLVDTNGDGRISLQEFEKLFENFDDGSEAARARQLGDFVDVNHVEMMVAQSFADRLGPMEKMLQTMDLMLRGEIRADHFRRTFIRFGLVLSNPETEALVAKYTIGEGNDSIDYIRFLHNIRTIVEAAEAPTPTTRSRASTSSSRPLATGRRSQGSYGQQSRSPKQGLRSSRLDSRQGSRSGHNASPASSRPLTAREQQKLVAAARKTGRLPALNTARGAARVPVNNLERVPQA